MLFNQRIGLIEATEELKRVNVDTKTFTRPLIHDYSSVARYVVPSLEGEVERAYTFADRNASGEAVNIRNSQYKNIYANDSTLSITELSWMFFDPPGPPSWVSIPTRVQVLSEAGVAQPLKTSSGAVVWEIQITQNTGNQIATCTLDIAGEYTVRYETIPSTAGTHYAEYPFYVVQQAKPKPDKTITEVINTVLNYACGNRNRHYVLDPVYAKKWRKIVAPEFFFTRNTLYEALLTIGGYRDIQAIPRLKWTNGVIATNIIGGSFAEQLGYEASGVEVDSYDKIYTGEYRDGVSVKKCAFWRQSISGTKRYQETYVYVWRGSTVLYSGTVRTRDDPDGSEMYNAQFENESDTLLIAYAYNSGSNHYEVQYTVTSAGLRLITFDDLNVESEWTPPGATTSDPYGNLITYHEEQSADDYFAGLDSYADNVIDNSVNGSIGLPSPYTPRCESGDLAVTDNTIIIETSMPIYSVQKVELFYKGDGTSAVSRDITPYIFEKSEYDLLTDYQGEFPTAKQYAFYYSQGARNIYGLTLKPEVFDFLGISQAAQETAAIKVYEAVSGKEFDSATQKVIDFMYRVTYTPIQTRRLKQYRPLVGERPDWDISYYNQSANTLDAKNLGDNMKFMLLQKGNRLKVVTYRLTGDTGSVLEQIPKIGQTLNGAKICQVDAEYERYSVKVTLWLTEHYNRKSQYVEINAQKRFYEISERQSVLRQLNASYEYRIGKVDPDADKAIISADLIESFIKGTTPTNTDNRVAQAIVKMYTEDDGNGEQIGDALLLPVSAIGFGNSISLHFEMTDNYSAGDQVIYKDSTDTNSVSLLRAVPYGDEYGEFISMTIGFLGGEIPWAATEPDWTNYRTVGRTLPEMDASLNDDETPLFADVLNVAKDNREQISVDVQIHFRTDNSSIVIGSAFGERFPYVNAHIGTDDEKLEWVELTKPIAPLQNRLTPDQYRASRGFDIETEPGDGFVKIAQITALDPDISGDPWGDGVALIVKNTGELVFGVNAIPHKKWTDGTPIYGYFFGDNFCFPTKVKPL